MAEDAEPMTVKSFTKAIPAQFSGMVKRAFVTNPLAHPSVRQLRELLTPTIPVSTDAAVDMIRPGSPPSLHQILSPTPSDGFSSRTPSEYSSLAEPIEGIDDVTFDELWRCANLDDDDLIGMLNASKGKIDAAASLAVSSLRFHDEFGASPSMTDDGIMRERETGKAWVRGTDYEGCPVVVVQLRKHKIGHSDLAATKRFGVWLAEQAMRRIRETGQRQFLLVFDMSGISVRENVDIPFVKWLARSLLDVGYPDRAKYILLYEPPWLFWSAWRLIRTMLSTDLREKVQLVSRGQMAEYVPLDQLPTEMGGVDPWKPSKEEDGASGVRG